MFRNIEKNVHTVCVPLEKLYVMIIVPYESYPGKSWYLSMLKFIWPLVGWLPVKLPYMLLHNGHFSPLYLIVC